ncbi:MAG: DinB family protein [Calditrichia bacterium]
MIIKHSWRKPQPGYYSAEFEPYIKEVPEDDILTIWPEQLNATMYFFRQIPPEKLEYRYKPDKWTIKEILGHLIDTERIFGYRCLCIARGEINNLPTYDDNEYVRFGSFNDREYRHMMREYEIVKKSNYMLFESLPHEALYQIGNVGGVQMAVLAIPYILLGHELHHLEVIKSKYLDD